MKKYSIFIFLFIFLFTHINGQNLYFEQAQQLIPGAKHVRLNKQTNKIEYFELEVKTTKKRQVSNFENFLCNSFQLNEKFNFKKVNEHYDRKEIKHIRYQQTLNGIPIEGMIYIGHFKNDIPISANGTYTDATTTKNNISISTTNGFELAKKAVPSQHYKETNENMIEGAKTVYLLVENQPVLCLKYDIYSLEPLDRKFVYINAENGNIEKTITRIQNTDKVGIAYTLFNGEKEITTDSLNGYFRLYESGRANNINTLDLRNNTSYNYATEITDNDNVWDSTFLKYNAAYDAHFGTEMTYDYYLLKFGRNSIDNNGAALVSYVNYSYSYNNAFWDGEKMTYGGGDGITYYPFTSIDIVAHEITHGLTERTANLEYSYESGALNESFSDIFGVCIDFFANPETANYLMGEQTKISGTPIRSMENPNSLGDPDTYQGNYWVTGSSDGGGVHTNSSVQNYWFYLLSEGGSGTNDFGSNYAVKGIGRDKAAEIAYRTLTVYLTTYSQFEDAKNYSIQSAIDLYGACSQEVISVTNAWFAVGVGQPFNNSVQASFKTSQNFSCSYPVDIYLTNTSINADSISWYINDNYIGNEDSTVFNFTASGYYDIKLLAYGTALCNSTDTLNSDSIIHISYSGSPKNTSCAPNTIYSNNGGISYVKIGFIDNISQVPYGGYEDFTCTNQATLTAGKLYPILVNTINPNGENVYVWFDADNSGVFEADEKIFTSNNNITHTGYIMIPEVTQYDTPLRLRIGSDYNYNLTTACTQPRYGQYEDYSIIVRHNLDIPIVDFYSSDIVAGPGATISFIDSCQNLPTSYFWTFEGGTPSTSTLKNPQVLYSQVGDYDVSLIASNSYGSDTIVKTDFIHISNSYNMGEQDSTVSGSGILYDSGGKNGNYQNYESYSFVIAPPCADSIILSVDMIDFYSSSDYMRIYDGPVNDNNLLWYSNNGVFSGTLTTTTGKTTVVFTSNYSGTSNGFELSWQTHYNNGLNAPVANIEIADNNPPFNTEVLFKDATTNDPHSWQWNINNEYWDFSKNTKYSFKESGQKFIELIATNCHSSDTVEETINVQTPPELSIGINSFSATLDVGDSIVVNIPISNLSATGDLVVGITEIDTSNFNFENITYKKTFEGSINEDGKEHLYSYDAVITPSTALEGIKILICGSSYANYSQLQEEMISKGAKVEAITNYPYPDLDTYQFIILDDGSTSYYSTTEIRNYLINGGNVIINGDEQLSYFNNILVSTGINYQNNSSYSGYTSNISQHPVTKDISQYYINSSALSILTTTNSGLSAPLIYDFYNNLYSAIATLGSGKALLICNEDLLDSYIQNLNHLQLLNNFIDYASNNSSNIKYDLLEDSLYINAQHSDTFKISINTKNTIGGFYKKEFLISSNDTAHEEIIIPFYLKLIGIPEAEYNKDTIDFGLSYVGTSYTDSLIIENVGTDTLIIDSIRTTNNDFTLVNSIYEIPVRGKTIININLLPTSAKNYTDSLFIYSDALDGGVEYIRLFATSAPPPIIEFDKDSIVDYMFTNDSTEHILTITNKGVSPLILGEYYLEPGLNSTYLTDKILNNINIVAYAYGSNPYSPFITRILQLGGNYNPSDIISKELLDTTDVLLLTDNAYLSTSQIAVIKDYINNGGSVLLAGDYSQNTFNQILSGSGLSYNDSYSCNSGYAPIINNHPTTQGIDSIYIISASSVIQVHDTVNSAISLVEDLYNNCYAAASMLGKGKIITFADRVFTLSSYTNYDFEMKCLEWLGNNSWLKVDNYILDTLATNETCSFNVKTKALNLPTGVYKQQIVIPSNDPANKLLSIPVTLNVTGIGIISLSENEVTFDTIFSSSTSTKEIVISNIGTENLNIIDIYLDNEAFSIDNTDITIAPNKNINLAINFSPESDGVYEGILTIKSDSKDTSSTVNLLGYSILPPVMSVNPESIDITTYPGKTVDQTFTIGNTEGNSDLQYIISINDNTQGDTSSADYLVKTLSQLNAHYSEVNSIIPNRFDFSNGTSSYYISDGGNDMFDGGNYLYTNQNYSYINYSDNNISYLNLGNVTGRYFTRKFDGLFVFVGDMSGINSFHVRGNLGSTPSSHDSCVIEKTIGSKSYKGFVARMYNYSRPSVNHLIIVENNMDVNHTFTLSYDDYYHNINNLNRNAKIHHLLFASNSGQYITNDEMDEIMNAYLNIINPSPEWIELDNYSETLSAGESNEINATIRTNNLDFGTYRANIEITSNDPTKSYTVVPVTLSVVDNQPPEVISNLSNKIIFSCENGYVNLNKYFQDPDNDLLIYTINNSAPNVTFPSIIDDSLFYYNPIASGISEIELKVKDGIHEPISTNFTIKVIDNLSPGIISALPDTQIYINDEPLIINLDDVFSDPEEDIIEYNFTFSDTSIISSTISGSYLILTPKKEGLAVVNITVKDNVCGYVVKEGFILRVKQPLVGIEKIKQDNFNLYPNPASGNIFIKGQFGSTLKAIEIIDMNGIVSNAEIQNQSNEQITLDISNLKPGFYVLKIMNENSIVIKRFIKQ